MHDDKNALAAKVKRHVQAGAFIPGVKGDRPVPLSQSELAALNAPPPLSVDTRFHPSLWAAHLLLVHRAPWEAHEVLEALWHACGRTGPAADVVKACIKLCASEVKRLQGVPQGQQSHAHGALALVRSLVEDASVSFGPISLPALERACERAAVSEDAAISGLPLCELGVDAT